MENLENPLQLVLKNKDLDHVPEAILSNAKLQYLDLSYNQISSLPASFVELKSLRSLFLHENEFHQFPEVITELINLRYLVLTANHISSIPSSISKLVNLEYLELDINEFDVFPMEILSLPKLSQLQIFGNAFNDPPLEVVKRGPEAIKNYFAVAKRFSKYDNLYELKLLLVGEGRAGKTSLMRSLTHAKHTLDLNEPTTQGISVEQWVIKKEELNFRKDIRFNIWDFGGQEIYYSTHQIFLTKRSLYILVLESRKDQEHAAIYYWLNIIRHLGDKSPIIITQHKCDLPTIDLPRSVYFKEYTNICNLVRTSCLDDFKHTIDSLKGEIIRIIRHKDLLPHIGTPLPEVWVNIRQSLLGYLDAGVKIMPLHDFLNVCQRNGLNEKEGLFLSEYLHDIGVILHFQKDIKLKNSVFLDHGWLTNCIYMILDDQQIIDKHGSFDSEDISRIWHRNDENQKTLELLSLMEKFGLCYELRGGGFLAPLLFQAEEPAKVSSDNESKCLVYQYPFMPRGIISRITVKLHTYVQEGLCWKYGVVLVNKEGLVIIREDFFDKSITISTSGDVEPSFLYLLCRNLEEIHSEFSDLVVNELIVCICEDCKTSDSPALFDKEELARRKSKGKITVECQKFYNDVFIDILLSDNPESERKVLSGRLNPTTIDKWLEFIANGDIKTTLTAVLEHSKLGIIEGEDLGNQIIALFSRFSNLNARARVNIIDTEYYDMEMARITGSLIHLITELKIRLRSR